VCYFLILVSLVEFSLFSFSFSATVLYGENQDKELPSMGQQWAQSVTAEVRGF